MNQNIPLLLAIIALTGVNSDVQQLPEVHGDKFYYYGFGSNMLAKRIHIQNPTAEIIGPALLEDYRVDFSLVSQFWKGAVATIVPSPGSKTWGTLWEIDLTNLPDIDNQERVHLGWYKPVSVQVKLQNNATEIPARLYVISNEPKGNVHDLPPSEVPEDRQPSKTYLQVLVKGAIESGLPEEYVTWLKGFKHNNQTVQHLEELLETLLMTIKIAHKMCATLLHLSLSSLCSVLLKIGQT